MINKHADAMSRAFEQGRLTLGSPEHQVDLDAKIRSLPPRASGNMGLLRSAPRKAGSPAGVLAAGAEGDAYLGAMRGKGLGIKKVFPQHPASDPRSQADFQNIKTRTVPARVEHMKSVPEVYPEIYRSTHNPSKPQFGTIDMEYIPGKELVDHKYPEIAEAYKSVDNKMKSRGYVGVANNMYHEATDTMVGDLHAGNVKIDARTGQAKILDPMVHKGRDVHGARVIKQQMLDYGVKPNQTMGAVRAPSRITTGHVAIMANKNMADAIDRVPVGLNSNRGLMNLANIHKPWSQMKITPMSQWTPASASSPAIARSAEVVSGSVAGRLAKLIHR